jgi:hypothetical protein
MRFSNQNVVYISILSICLANLILLD